MRFSLHNQWCLKRCMQLGQSLTGSLGALVEEKYGRRWVIRTSCLTSAIIVSAILYSNLFIEWECYLMLFLGLTFTTPGLIRYVICRRWEPVEAEIESSEDLSRAHVLGGGASMVNFYQADIKYHVGEALFKAKITSAFPFKKSKTIFYDPVTPSVFTQNKSPGLYGLGFLVVVVLSILKVFEHY